MRQIGLVHAHHLHLAPPVLLHIVQIEVVTVGIALLDAALD